MATFFLIISAILFIATFEIDLMISNGHEIDKPMYTYNPLFSIIPWISGFILPVVPFALVFDYHWLAIFFINLVAVLIVGPRLTKGILAIFATGRGHGYDMLYSFIGGIITLIIGLIL